MSRTTHVVTDVRDPVTFGIHQRLSMPLSGDLEMDVPLLRHSLIVLERGKARIVGVPEFDA